MNKKFIQKIYKESEKKLFKLNRSLTGKDNLKTLNFIKNYIPDLNIKKIKSRTKVYDWVIPDEWNVKDAFIEDKDGKKIINFKKNNLHLISYSINVDTNIRKKDLFKKIHYLKNLPEAIPYRTSYYKKDWGFCISYDYFNKLNRKYDQNDIFRVKINSNHDPRGKLVYGEYFIEGKTTDEILISTYICHPSMANNELSGILVSISLAKYFKNSKPQKGIRFVFIPETIGSIAYISKNLKNLKSNVIGGYNLTCIGDDRIHSCMLSKNKNSPSDESLFEAYEKLNIKKYKVYPFSKRGSDERQYCSPGVDLPITSIFRSKYGEYKEYHTSLDNYHLMTVKGLLGGFRVAKKAIELLQKKIIPKNKILCEPNLGSRNLFRNNISKDNFNIRNLLDFLQYTDGKTSLNLISKKIKLKLDKTFKLYKILLDKKIIN